MRPNLNYIKQLSQGDLDFESKLLAVINREFPVELNKYEQSITAESFSETADIVHKIKHTISIFGMEKSFEIANTFENNLREDNAELQAEFEKILQVIRHYLTTI